MRSTNESTILKIWCYLISNDRQPSSSGETNGVCSPPLPHGGQRHGDQSNPVPTRFVDAGVRAALGQRVAVRGSPGDDAVAERVFLSALRRDGERTGGKAGRGPENKVPFVTAVSLSDQCHPLRAQLTLVPGFTLKAIAQWSSAGQGVRALLQSTVMTATPAHRSPFGRQQQRSTPAELGVDRRRSGAQPRNEY